MQYRNADEWRAIAMERPDGVGAEEREQRRQIARDHYAKTGMEPDEDTLTDHELYIRGKMELEEYQAYLVFKYGKPGEEG